MNRMDRREIVECNDLAALSLRAAEHFTALARARVTESGRFTVALAGGSTPRSLYALLATAAYRERVPWAATHLFFGDERCVAPDHPESNFRMVKEALLDHVPIPGGQVHRMQGEDPQPERAAGAYEDELRHFFVTAGDLPPRFDLVLLGLGADGHTASLFPGAPSLDVDDRLAVAAEPGLEPFVERVTMTIPAGGAPSIGDAGGPSTGDAGGPSIGNAGGPAVSGAGMAARSLPPATSGKPGTESPGSAH